VQKSAEFDFARESAPMINESTNIIHFQASSNFKNYKNHKSISYTLFPRYVYHGDLIQIGFYLNKIPLMNITGKQTSCKECFCG